MYLHHTFICSTIGKNSSDDGYDGAQEILGASKCFVVYSSFIMKAKHESIIHINDPQKSMRV